MGSIPTPGANARIGSAEIGLNTQSSAPPTQAYVGKDDSIWVGAATQNNGLVVTLNARYLMPDGNIQLTQQTFRYAQSRALAYQQMNLPECFLLSVAATCNFPASGIGSVYIEVVLSRFAPTLFSSAQILCQGYSTSNQPVSWPGGANSTSVDCAGAIFTGASSVPAAGANFNLTVPANAKWNVLGLQFTFTTSAAVANRVMTVTFDDGLNTFTSLVQSTVQPASNVWVYSYAPGLQNQTVVNNTLMNAMPMPTKLLGGYRIRSNVLALQAGDQFTAAIVSVEEWLLP
jgi:hypothetical protein